MNLPPELEVDLNNIQKDYAKCNIYAPYAVDSMFVYIADKLPEENRAQFVMGVIFPFVDTAYADNRLSGNDTVSSMFEIADRLPKEDRAEFVMRTIFPLMQTAYVNGKLDADDMVLQMLNVLKNLPEEDSAKFALDIILPFVQTANSNGELQNDRRDNLLTVRIYRSVDKLPEPSRQHFFSELGIFDIDLKTNSWKTLTSKWNSVNNNGNKMVLLTKPLGVEGAPFAICDQNLFGMQSLVYMLDDYGIRGRNRTPFLNAVKAVKIEQEHPGFFASLDKLCRSLKAPAVS